MVNFQAARWFKMVQDGSRFQAFWGEIAGMMIPGLAVFGNHQAGKVMAQKLKTARGLNAPAEMDMTILAPKALLLSSLDVLATNKSCAWILTIMSDPQGAMKIFHGLQEILKRRQTQG